MRDLERAKSRRVSGILRFALEMLETMVGKHIAATRKYIPPEGEGIVDDDGGARKSKVVAERCVQIKIDSDAWAHVVVP